jgi:menaquinone-dependent protoporphyrinogen oxidase
VRILIVFASRYGQARRLARFVGERLANGGCEVRVRDAGERPWPDPAGFDAVLLVGGLHILRLPAPLRRFARRNRNILNHMPSALVCISLSAAGDEPRARAGLDKVVERFVSETGWRPNAVHHAPGEMKFSAYGPLTGLVIAWIARGHGFSVEPGHDYDLADYEALGVFAQRFVAAVGR